MPEAVPIAVAAASSPSFHAMLGIIPHMRAAIRKCIHPGGHAVGSSNESVMPPRSGGWRDRDHIARHRADLAFDRSRAILALRKPGEDHDKDQEAHRVGVCCSRAEHGLAVHQQRGYGWWPRTRRPRTWTWTWTWTRPRTWARPSRPWPWPWPSLRLPSRQLLEADVVRADQCLRDLLIG